MRARLHNLASRRRLAWTELAVPYGSIKGEEATFLTDNNLRLRAVRGAHRGEHSTFYRVLAPFIGYDVIDGTMLDEPAVQDGNTIFFTHSSWVVDDLEALMPRWVVRVHGHNYYMINPKVEVVDNSRAHERWRVHGEIEELGFWGTFYVTFYHQQDVADVECRLTWSDRTVTHMGTWVESVFIECGEFISFDFDKHTGMREPTKVGDKWVIQVTDPIEFADASSITAFGRMLCVRQQHHEGFDVDTYVEEDEIDHQTDLAVLDPTRSPNAWYKERMESLLAAYEAPTQGLVLDQSWNSQWLSHKWTPRHQPNPNPARGEDYGDWRDAEKYHQSLMRRYQTVAPADTGRAPSSMYHPRPHVILSYPGSTGTQPDFGSTKGSFAVSLDDPRWIWHCYFCLQGELFRGIMHFEEDGSPVLFENHPKWITWGGQTHFRQRPKDTLGKESTWGNSKSTGHHGQDDQHRSGNMLSAFLALRDSPIYMDFVHHWITNDQAMQKNRLGAARAVGRLTLDWAHKYLITDGDWKARVKSVMDEKKQAVINKWMGGLSLGSVKPLNVAGPDRRSGVHDGNGNPLPTWVPWQESIAAVGFYATWKATGDQWYFDMAKTICRTVVEHGIFEEGGRFYICYAVWYPWGDGNWGRPITEFGATYKTSYDTGEVNAVNIGLSAWSIPAVLMLCEMDANKTTDDVDPVAEKAKLIRKQYTGDGEAKEWEKAEWWACVEKVVQ